MAIDVSVVIPTHDRLPILLNVLRALERQHDAPPCEVIVADDGSADGTAEALERSSFALPVRVTGGPNRGPAAARNRGIDLAQGRLVAFLGDDTIPEPGWLAAHARAHRERAERGPYAVVGYTRWHDQTRPSAFMRFINERGLQFGYALIGDRDDVPFKFFYASNLSVPRELLRVERFDERFAHPVWEDIELGYRLVQRHGLRLAYCPDAVAAHDHATSVRRFMARQESAGRWAALVHRLHPELAAFLEIGADGPPPTPPRRRHVLVEWVARAAEPLPIELPGLWRRIARYHYVKGLHRGWAERDRLEALRPDPFLHVEREGIYSPIADRTLQESDPGYRELRALAADELTLDAVPAATRSTLRADGWLVADGPDLARRFRLKYVSLEAHTVCNQACYFCPVSIAPRARHFMSDELYARIVGELAEYRQTIEAVFMINYNEPTADPRFVDQVRLLTSAGLPPAVLTNGSGLTPERVDAIVGLGGLRFLSVNLSTLDRQRYAADRGVDQLDLVLRNLDYAKDRPLAAETDLVVLGQGDDVHRRDFGEIRERFAGSRFTVKYFEVMDRAGYLTVGLKPTVPHPRLCGCENVGSRPLQHLHITPHGRCVLCCEDYAERYPVGDLTTQSVREVLAGEPLARMRRLAYGLQDAPVDFICRRCVFARTR